MDQPSGRDIQSGRLLHQISRDFLRHPPSARTTALILSLLERQLALRKHSGWVLEPAQIEFLHATLSGLSLSHVAAYEAFALEYPSDVRSNEWLLRGRIDFIGEAHDGLHVIDFKRTARSRYRQTPDHEKYLQVLLYAAGTPIDVRTRINTVGLYYFDAAEVDRIAFTEESVAAAIALADTTIRTIQRETEFAPTVNPLCQSCGFRRRCPALQSAATTA
jgi:CRISPR/Cas system-associated exonuclease Cas4 (RecB family)